MSTFNIWLYINDFFNWSAYIYPMHACADCRRFVSQVQRPFGVRYNPYTQSVELLTNTDKVAALVSELRGDLCIVRNALDKIQVSG